VPRLSGDGAHSVACHFWRDFAHDAAAAPAPPAARNERLERLQAAFRASPSVAAPDGSRT